MPLRQKLTLPENFDLRELELLNPREQLVLRMRFGLAGEGRHTLRAIGEAIGVGGERTRQIEHFALVKLHKKRDPNWRFRRPAEKG